MSPAQGTYCAVMPEEIEEMQLCIDNKLQIHSTSLYDRLKGHGFFCHPRPFRSSHHLIQFQVTNACNLHCVYCSADSGRAYPNEISLDDVKRTIDEATQLFPDIQISFTGGEPLLVPWLFDAIDYAAQRSHESVGLLSNLLLLKNNPELFEKTVACLKDDIITLQMSISAADREACDRLSGCICYDDAIEIIRRLGEFGVYPKVDVMISAPDAQANIDAFADFRRSLPSEVQISLGIIYPCGREKGKHVFSSSEEMEKVFDEIAFDGGVSVPGEKLSSVTYRRKACRCIENENIYIRSDGTIFSCFKLVEPLGHISEGLKTVLERRRKTSRFASESTLCSHCPFVSLCASGCHADNIIYQKSTKLPICGKWRRQVIAEMLFEDKSYVLDWPLIHQMAEAKKRGISIKM